MAAIFKSGNLTRGRALFGMHGEQRGSVRQQTHDGDTVIVVPDGNLGVRFLGIDTPEKSYPHPEIDAFRNIYPYFVEYLTDPFSTSLTNPTDTQFRTALGSGLVGYLQQRLGTSCAFNHWNWADRAEDRLEEILQVDVERTGSVDEYKFFMAFAYEIMDGYGRFLCYLHQDLPAEERGGLSYNERMLQEGLAMPYFIWPNINPFRKEANVFDAIPDDPTDFRNYVDGDVRLSQARQFVSDARNAQIGLFNPTNPLMLEPFELRFLAKRYPPSRRVIDMTQDPPVLLKGTDYYTIQHAENRLFINDADVPLFVNKGYTIDQ
jgi:endonuclease YncB( thermonuclease family)